MAIPLPRSRRTLDRHRIPDATTSHAEFRWPQRNGETHAARLRDISFAGISLQVDHELPGLEVGASLKALKVHVNGIHFRGELLLLHVTPSPEGGWICGGLFYPTGDADVLALRKLVRRFDAAS